MSLTSIPSQRRDNLGGQPPVSKKKILVVDDDAVVIWALSTKLKANGFDAFSARDGAEAVNSVRKHRPDLILLDLSFPPDTFSMSWDGFLIMDWLKHVEEAANVPIVVITAGDDEQCKDRARAAGAAALFHKPINHDELFSYIRRKLNVKNLPAAR